jgi:hypothetical protein
MAKYTEASILAELQSRKYPMAYFTSSDLSQVISAALRDLDRYCPTPAIARFRTLTEIQDYFCFNVNDQAPPAGYPQSTAEQTTDEGTQYVVPAPLEQPDGSIITYTGTHGICAGALEILDCQWNPGGDFSSLNVFSPGWQLLSQTIIYSGSYFNMPGLMMILNQKLNAFKKQFGEQGFEVIGPVGDPESFIRIYPLPLESESPVIVKFLKTATLDSIKSQRIFTWLMMAIEARLCEAAANFLSQSAGTSLLGFTDSTAAMKFFQTRADKKWTEFKETLGGAHGAVDRS